MPVAEQWAAILKSLEETYYNVAGWEEKLAFFFPYVIDFLQ